MYLYSSDHKPDFKGFSITKATFGLATPIIKNLTFNFSTEVGFELGGTGVNSLNFVFGGYGNHLINNFTPFLGYNFLSFTGDSYVKASGKIDYEFAAKNHIHFTANYANAGNSIFNTGEWFTPPDFSGYSIGYGLESFCWPY